VRGDKYKISLIGLLQSAAVLTVVFSFLTGFDIRHHRIELFSHFRLQYFAVSVLLLILFAWRRHYLYAGALGATTIFNAIFVLPWYFSADITADGAPLKLIHANVRASSTDYSRLTDFIDQEDPDVIFLQEVTPAWIAGTQKLQKDYPYTYIVARDDSYGIAAFSKIEFDSVQHIASPPLDLPTVLAAITFNGEALRIIGSHPKAPIGRFLYDARNEQLKHIADLVIQSSGKVVLLGDFNASMWCPSFRQLETSTGLRNAAHGFGVLPSWPTFIPFAMIPIDHALVSEGIGVLDIRTGDKIGSDHLPLIVTVAL
jgi:endonuclease/exonuclease/phosphatase (EEP) superfamily protein YafD